MAEVIVPTPEGKFAFPDQQAADRFLQATGAKPEIAPMPSTETPGGRTAVRDELLRATGGGAVRGALAPADMATAGGNLVMGGTAYGRIIETLLRKSGLLKEGESAEMQMPSKKLDEAGFIPHAQTGPGKYLEEGTAGAVGGLLMPGAVGPKVVAGAAGGIGGEAAQNAFPDSPYARIIGSLLSSVASYPALQAAKIGLSSLGGRSTEAPKIVSQAARGMTDADWTAAQQVQDQGRSAGVNVTPIQAVQKPTGLPALQEQVTASVAGGPKMTEFLGKQNQDSARAGKGLLDTIAPPMEPGAAVLKAQDAATGAVRKAEKFATSATAGDYTINSPKVWATDVKDTMDRMRGVVGASPAARDFIKKNVLDLVEVPVGKGTAVTNRTEELKNILNEAKTKLDAQDIASSGIDRAVAGKVRASLNELEGLVSSATANRPQGHAIYGEIYDRIVNPMKQSLTGQIAGKTGTAEDVVPPLTRVLGALNSDKIRAQSILQTQKDMARAGDPAAFPALVRATWEQNLEKAFKGTAESTGDAPAKFASSLWGTAEQTAKRENFRATLAAVARSHGVAEGPVVKGGENLMQVLEAAGKAKGGMGAPIQPGGSAVDSLAARVGPGSSNSVQFRMFQKIDSLLHGKAYSEIADMLTSKDGLKELQKLANFDLKAYRASMLSGAAAAQTTTNQEQ